MIPQVANARLRAAVATEQQPAAEDDHRYYRNNFDNGKPELHLAKHFNVGQVDGVNHHKEYGGRNPGWDFQIPELNVFTHGSQLCHGN